MNTYIALLRGINVSGQKIIKMELLRKALATLPFEDISTYIQSGNILFKSKITDISEMEHLIAATIKETFGFDVPVLIVTPAELKSVISRNPFAELVQDDPTQPYVAFLSEIPATEKLDTFKTIDFANDKWIHDGKALYLFYANSAGNTKLSNALIENKLKLKATSRNWKTIRKLIELSE